MTGKTLRYGALLLLVQAVAGCAKPESANQSMPQPQNGAAPAAAAAIPSADTKLVVAFGDSLFAGYNLAQTDGFAPRLQNALARAGIKAQVVNAGVSGDTSAAGLARLAFTLDGLPRKPDLVIVGLGGNDMLRGLSPAETRANLAAILTELRRRKIATMLTGMLASPNMGPDYAKSFDPIYPDLAKRFGAPLYRFFLDGVIGHRDLQLPDGIHPNARGVDVVVSRVAPLVGKAIGED